MLPTRAARYQIVVVSFSPTSAGEQGGKLTLMPASSAYRATTVDYRAIVTDASVTARGAHNRGAHNQEQH